MVMFLFTNYGLGFHEQAVAPARAPCFIDAAEEHKSAWILDRRDFFRFSSRVAEYRKDEPTLSGLIYKRTCLTSQRFSESKDFFYGV